MYLQTHVFVYALIKVFPKGWLYLWGLVSLIVLTQFRWIFNGLREKGFLEPRREGGQRENVPGNSHTHRRTHTHTALQQWEERATVTNSFGASKVAGNLSNGTIKLQLSFFSFFYSRCTDLGGLQLAATIRFKGGSLQCGCSGSASHVLQVRELFCKQWKNYFLFGDTQPKWNVINLMQLQ